MTVWSRMGVDRLAHYNWCDGVSLGSFGFVELRPGRPDATCNKALFAADVKSASARAYGHGHATSVQLTGARVTDISDNCIGEWEGIEVLLPKPEHGYFRKLHGGSYWVPPSKGGKELGWRMRQYMDPAAALFPYFEWMLASLEGLEKNVDMNRDQVITSAEFMKYVRDNDRVNQKWLSSAIQDTPCVVADAIVHYQHILRMGTLMRAMRAQCNKMEDRKACNEKNWVSFNRTFGGGPQYYFDDGDPSACSAIIQE